ncbi:rod shape-determining protein [Aminipila terrae]|uniref:Cell shape-determining protein MreB n=1 Tax=Aminipila terrae TaxID=2697030 RepID=A0A6P1MHW6_9FIRM|nr:rod shape-determining protein [Aminipila terrae]QHI73321.1 MreB/Mrl family cell shape determining protein [Aminipila terrae]
MFFRNDMGIDLGTANTLIYMKEKGIVLNEPSVIAMDKLTNSVMATGTEAKRMIGKTPATIEVVRPLREGVISDFDMTAEMIRVFIRRALGNKNSSNLRISIGVPSGVTEVEKRAVEEVVRQMGAKEVYILEEPMAAAIGSNLAIDDAEGCMICDIGGGTTDIAIIALGGIVTSISLRYAGDKLNDAIVAYMRKTFNLAIGDKTAEELKIKVGCAMMETDEHGNEVTRTELARGRDIISGLPATVEVTNRDMLLALEESVEIIIDGIKSTLEKAPPEIAADIVNNGLVLSGGGGMLSQLDKLISQKTGMSVAVEENAFEAVALGTGKSLENLDKLKRYACVSRR